MRINQFVAFSLFVVHKMYIHIHMLYMHFKKKDAKPKKDKMHMGICTFTATVFQFHNNGQMGVEGQAYSASAQCMQRAAWYAGTMVRVNRLKLIGEGSKRSHYHHKITVCFEWRKDFFFFHFFFCFFWLFQQRDIGRNLFYLWVLFFFCTLLQVGLETTTLFGFYVEPKLINGHEH